MGNTMYEVSHVARKDRKLWHDFWDNPSKCSQTAIDANRDGSLGLKEIIEAPNLNDAIRQVEQKFPENVVIRNACCRIGK